MIKIYKLSDDVFCVPSSQWGLYINRKEARNYTCFSSIDSVESRSSTTESKVFLDGLETTEDSISELTAKYFVINSDGDREFLYPGARDEYNAFCKRITRTIEQNVVYSALEYTIIEAPKIPSEYFKYLLSCNYDSIESFDLVRFKKASFCVDYFAKRCAELGLKSSVPDHSGIRFAKIDDEYIFSDKFKFEDPIWPRKIEDCIKEIESLKASIEERIDIYLSKKMKLDSKSVRDVVIALESMYDTISTIEVKKSHHDDRASLIRKVLSLRNSLLKTIPPAEPCT